MDNQPIYVALNKEELEGLLSQAALVGAQVAADSIRGEHAKELSAKKDRRLHNTRLLLSHYRDFREHCGKAVYDSRMAEKEGDLMEMIMEMKDDAIILESIQRTMIRTGTILEHIDRMVSVFKSYADKGGEREKRQYKVVYSYYLAPDRETIQDLSEELNVSRVTIYKDLKAAEEKLSVLFFGMDGLRFA